MLHLRTALAALGLAALLGAAPASLAVTPVVVQCERPFTGRARFWGNRSSDAFRATEIVVNATGGIHGRQLKIVAAGLPNVSPQSGCKSCRTTSQSACRSSSTADRARMQRFDPGRREDRSGRLLPLAGDHTMPIRLCVFRIGVEPPTFSESPFAYFRLRGWKRLAMLSATDASGVALEVQAVAGAWPCPRITTSSSWRGTLRADRCECGRASRAHRSRKTRSDSRLGDRHSDRYGVSVPERRGQPLPVQIPSSIIVYSQLESVCGVPAQTAVFRYAAGLTPDGAPGRARRADGLREGVEGDRRTARCRNKSCWDPTMIFVEALRHLGPDPTADQVRDYISHLHGWVGVNGVFDFGGGDQHGIGENAVDMAQWVLPRVLGSVSRPHGYLK